MIRGLIAFVLFSWAPAAMAGEAELRTRHEEMRAAPDLVSVETAGSIRGEIHGVLPHDFESVQTALAEPGPWCDILVLTYNVKRCRVSAASTLWILVGKSATEPVDQAMPMQFEFAAPVTSTTYLRRVLQARQGPMGTRNYEIVVEAIPVDARHSFLRLSYGYEYGRMSRVAMQVYLATAGAGKVGFTTDTDEHGRAQPVGGMRGVMERNTMRYFLAIGAYLDALPETPERRVQARLNAWFDACERYRRQLREMDRGEYLETKRALLAGD